MTNRPANPPQTDGDAAYAANKSVTKAGEQLALNWLRRKWGHPEADGLGRSRLRWWADIKVRSFDLWGKQRGVPRSVELLCPAWRSLDDCTDVTERPVECCVRMAQTGRSSFNCKCPLCICQGNRPLYVQVKTSADPHTDKFPVEVSQKDGRKFKPSGPCGANTADLYVLITREWAVMVTQPQLAKTVAFLQAMSPKRDSKLTWPWQAQLTNPKWRNPTKCVYVEKDLLERIGITSFELTDDERQSIERAAAKDTPARKQITARSRAKARPKRAASKARKAPGRKHARKKAPRRR